MGESTSLSKEYKGLILKINKVLIDQRQNAQLFLKWRKATVISLKKTYPIDTQNSSFSSFIREIQTKITMSYHTKLMIMTHR